MGFYRATVHLPEVRPSRLLGCVAAVWLTLFGPLRLDAVALQRPAALTSAGRLGLIPPHFTFAPYLQDVTSDSLIIAFATDVATTAVVRVYEPTDGGEDLETTHERTPKAVFLSPTGLNHRVRLTGLRSGLRYSYVVAARRPGDPAPLEASTSEAEFSTAPQTGAFSFLVYGDNRDRDADHAAVVAAMATEHTDLILQTGDMVSRASDEGQWRRYFHTAGPLLRSTPLYPTLGNHELRGDPEALHFHRLFVLPRSGLLQPSPKRRPVYYGFRYSNSLFLALDGNSPYDGEQAGWLEKTLQRARADASLRHIFVFIHQPPYAVGAYCGSERVARRLVPILQRYGVRAVFAGHEHAYQHLERDGLRFFISGGGGAPLYPRSQACNFEDDLALRLFRAEHHYLRVQVDGDAATLYAINQKGDLMERVSLQEPVREAPPMPESPFDAGPDGGPHPRRIHDAPLLALSTMAGAESGSGGSASRVEGLVRPHLGAAPKTSFGPLLLLWLSSIALLAGLLMLTRDLRPRRR